MYIPAVRTSHVPTPAELCDDPSSPWTIDEEGHYTQPTIIKEINRDTLGSDEKIGALLRSGLLDGVCRPLLDSCMWTDEDYPPQLMMLLLCRAREVRSENAMWRELDLAREQRSLWEFIRQAWHAHYGEHLPVRAPTRDELRAFRKKVTQPAVLTLMLEAFTDTSLDMAQAMGSLVFVRRGNLVDIFAYNVLAGDGTVTDRYSDIDEVTINGVTKMHGSKAKNPRRARVQRRTTDNSADGKPDLQGMNIAHVGTITYAGFVVLAVGAVETSEGKIALDLLERVLRRLAPGIVHGVVYDKAITGWHVTYLLAKYGVPVIGKATASNKKKADNPWEVNELGGQLKKAGDTAVAEQVKRRGKKKRSQLGHAERRAIVADATNDALARLRPEGTKDIPGLTVRTDSRGNSEVVASNFAELGTAEHTTGDGGMCVHRLLVDDNALTVLDEHGTKDHQPRVLNARVELVDSGYVATATWLVRCPEHGNFEHTERWTPSPARGPRQETRRRSIPGDGEVWRADQRRRALQMLRIIPEQDPRWKLIAGLRNVTESWHSTYKRLLPNKRGTSPDGNEQVLQYLAAVMSYNAERWERHRRYQQHLARRASA